MNVKKPRWKTILAWFAVATAWMLLAGAAPAQVLFQDNFNNRTVGAITDPQNSTTPNDPSDSIGNGGDNNNWWSWNGPTSGNVAHTWSFISDGSGGAALQIQVDGLLAVGTDWWWGLGIGKSGIYPPPGTSDFSKVQFSLDAQVLNPETNYTAPNNRYLNIHIEQWDPAAPSPTTPGQFGWWTLAADYRPAFPDANWQHIAFTLNQMTQATTVDGQPVPGVLRSDLQLNLRFDWSNWNDGNSMGLDDGNVLALDNLTITNLTPPAHAGDFDADGDVDGADFVAWQTNFPKASDATLAQGDADGDGDVDGADFVVWQTNFPFTPAPGASAVPEPAAAILLASAATMLIFRSIGRKAKLQRQPTIEFRKLRIGIGDAAVWRSMN
jgi:hypothetical protein